MPKSPQCNTHIHACLLHKQLNVALGGGSSLLGEHGWMMGFARATRKRRPTFPLYGCPHSGAGWIGVRARVKLPAHMATQTPKHVWNARLRFLTPNGPNPAASHAGKIYSGDINTAARVTSNINLDASVMQAFVSSEARPARCVGDERPCYSLLSPLLC